MKWLKDNFLVVISIACIGLGIYAFTVATNIDSEGTFGTYVETEKYGGDAYTGIQNAGADGANNVRAFGRHLTTEIEYIMRFVGVTFIVGGVVVLLYYVADKGSKPKPYTMVMPMENIPVEQAEDE